jgi:hypothetical protein
VTDNQQQTLCVLEHEQRTAATAGLLTCRKHRRDLDDFTHEISLLIVDTQRIVDGGAPSQAAPKTRHMKQAEAPAPGDLAIMALYDSRTLTARIPETAQNPGGDQSEPMVPVLHVVASWLLLVAEERPLTATLPRSVLAQLDLLTRHHDWLAASLFVDDYHAEMKALVRHLRTATNDHTHHRVATCDLPSDNGQASVLFIRKNRPLRVARICGGAVLCRNGESGWRCARCGESWVTDQQKARFAVRAA